MPKDCKALHFMRVLDPVFTKPTFITFMRLVVGWILCPTRRTITGIYPFADTRRKRVVQVYHYFFRDAAWLQAELFSNWARYLVQRLCANQKTLLLSIDDTTHKKTGPKISGARICRDAVRSTVKDTVFCWALQYIPLCLVFHPPWGGEPLSIPINVRLNRKHKPEDAHVTLLDHVEAMLRELAVWLPEHNFHLVADGAYAPLARRKLPRTALICRMRSDAALYDLPEPRQPGKRGRPRSKGARLPKPKELVKSVPTHLWRRVETCERKVMRERLVHVWVVVWAHVSKEPLLLIVSRDPEGKESDDFFFSTDVNMAPATLISEFADRWSVEDTFRNVKQFLGAEEPQSWKDAAPERAGAFSYMLYGVVWLARLEREGDKTATMEREWYEEKTCVSFLDALADVRQRLWNERIFAMSSNDSECGIIQKLLIKALAWAA
jgi:hypothetical protein